ncbi:hypothetical protein G7051_13270 [Dysgonomonas sp. HDW5B]|uniref:hypothetical protein n=1 Tax=Dysgonomonas sp. HDW5B TaxID=2714927 RepID=UPI0014072334|nr:hypothetical protein [Dysgonomonas sp. HDW5B]QIK55260.1 hypothetical protein G7051_13270 [Dysgonomonas sp. HDW5B]
MKPLITGKAYNIQLFYNPDRIEAMYLKYYTDLFGEEYESVFITSDGRLFEIGSVEKWD